MRDTGGAWVGWPGVAGDVDLAKAPEVPELAYDLVPVSLSAGEVERYYEGFANEILWPLFHDLHAYCDFDPEFWETYREVNRRFADCIAQTGGEDAWVWLHDYHLIPAGADLRELGDERPAGFFLHTPFPPAETLERLPWHRALLEALPAYDLVGLQTRRDVANLRDAVTSLVDTVDVVTREDRLFLAGQGDRAEVGFFPISVDVEDLETQAGSQAVDQRLAQLRAGLPTEDHVYVVGVERLDYTKGIVERLQAFDRFLEDRPELAGQVTLLQHVNPSREGIEHYESLRERVDRAVGRINAEHGTVAWQPIRYTYGRVDFAQVLALYRLADVCLVTSLMDGMNLVAKEYCAANLAEDGVLVLSKFAGAAEELCDNALVVNPHDVERTARVLHEACTMPADERSRRMRNLRARLREHDVHRWARTFLDRLDPQSETTPPDPASSATVTFPGSLRRPREDR
jgi:trehalose 6-phosphate synthase